MSDPVACLALSVMPIIASWNEEATVPPDRNGLNEDGSPSNMNQFWRKLFACDGIYEDWWHCTTLPCRPCAPDAFFQLDEDDEVAETQPHHEKNQQENQ